MVFTFPGDTVESSLISGPLSATVNSGRTIHTMRCTWYLLLGRFTLECAMIYISSSNSPSQPPSAASYHALPGTQTPWETADVGVPGSTT